MHSSKYSKTPAMVNDFLIFNCYGYSTYTVYVVCNTLCIFYMYNMWCIYIHI